MTTLFRFICFQSAIYENSRSKDLTLLIRPDNISFILTHYALDSLAFYLLDFIRTRIICDPITKSSDLILVTLDVKMSDVSVNGRDFNIGDEVSM